MKGITLAIMISVSACLVVIELLPHARAKASTAEPAFAPVAEPQDQTPRPIRQIPNLEEIRVWLGLFGLIAAGRNKRRGASLFAASSPSVAGRNRN